MTLTGGNLTTPLTTTTAPDGTYSFTGLQPGTYTVTQTQPTAHNICRAPSTLPPAATAAPSAPR